MLGNEERNEKARKEWIGKSDKMKCGLIATVMSYTNSHLIRVRFEDGYETNTTTFHFKKQMIKHPDISGWLKDRTGERIQQKNGEFARIIKYNTTNDIVVEFDNGVQKHSDYSSFKNKKLTSRILATPREITIGSSIITATGKKCYLKEKKKDTFVVEFENGYQKEIDKTCFQNGRSIADHDIKIKEMNVGDTYMQNNGLLLTIIEYKDSHHVIYEWEDGVVGTAAKKEILKGKRGHPSLHVNKENKFHGFKCKMVIRKENNVYYKVLHEDGFEGIMTPQEMLRYE